MKKNIKNKLKNKLKPQPVVNTSSELSGENMADILSSVSNNSMLSILGNEIVNEINATLTKTSMITGKVVSKSMNLFSGMKTNLMSNISKRMSGSKNKINYNVENLKHLKNIEEISEDQIDSLDDITGAVRAISSLNTENEILNDTTKESYSVLEDIKSILGDQLKTAQEGISDKELTPDKPEEKEKNKRDSEFKKKWDMWTKEGFSHNTDYGIVDLVTDSLIATIITAVAASKAWDNMNKINQVEAKTFDDFLEQLKKGGTSEEDIKLLKEVHPDSVISEYSKQVWNRGVDLLGGLTTGTQSLMGMTPSESAGKGMKIESDISGYEAWDAANKLADVLAKIDYLKTLPEDRKSQIEMSRLEKDKETYQDLLDRAPSEELFEEYAKKLLERNKDVIVDVYKGIFENLPEPPKLPEYNKPISNTLNDIRVPNFEDTSNIFGKPVKDAIIQDDKVTPFKENDVVSIGTNLSGNKNEVADIIAKSLQNISTTDNSNLESIMKDNNMLLRTFLSAISGSLKNTKGNVLMSQNVNVNSPKSTSLSPPRNKFANK